MMKCIQLKPIHAGNVQAAFDLELEEGQKIYVSHPMRSLALAYVYRDRCRPFGVYDGEAMVGYAMVRYDRDAETYVIWHFMIDKGCQGRGYGRAALNALLDFIRTKPLGYAKRILLTCHPENKAALKLYGSAGFEKTGRTEGVEIELEMPL